MNLEETSLHKSKVVGLKDDFRNDVYHNLFMFFIEDKTNKIAALNWRLQSAGN